MKHIATLPGQGYLQSYIAREYECSILAKALEQMQTGRTQGKIAVSWKRIKFKKLRTNH